MSHLSRVFQLVRNRQPVRRFADRPVPPELLARVLDCGRFAPSAGEEQPWRFVIVQDRPLRHRIAEAAFHSDLVRSAPVLILGCARITSRVSGHGRPAFPIDLAAATQCMAIAATDLGLQASWITGYREAPLRALVGIPPEVPVISLLAVGYPDGFGRLPDRRPESEVVAWDHWDGGDR